jgi:hypothetical protein
MSTTWRSRPKPTPPAVAIAGVDRGGALIQARDDANLRVEVAVFKRHLVSTAEVVALR